MSKRIIFLLFILVLIAAASQRSVPYLRQLFLASGTIEEQINIAGTGSMYPTFPKGEGTTDIMRASEIVAWPSMRKFPAGIKIWKFNLFGYSLTHGDIVEFENERTKAISREKYNDEGGFVKRVVALSGDSLELRDGYVKLNNQVLDEPWTAKPRSTFGGDFLADCQPFKIPEGKVFVMGDNRKASFDSRFDLRLVDLADVKYVLPWQNQEDYKKNWRDTKDDLRLGKTVTLEAMEFVKLLNLKRQEKNLKPLKYNPLLSTSGRIRGEAMIKFNDFSSEATRSGINLTTALKQSGYSNIIFAEVSTRGSYEADELLENFLEFPQTQKILMTTTYQDIGVSGVFGEINSCPVQVVVAHLGGYVPPNYSNKEIESWQKLIDNINEVYPSWEQTKNAQGVNIDVLNNLLVLFDKRRENAKKILTKMKANLWLSEQEKKLIEEDSELAQEADRLISLLK